MKNIQQLKKNKVKLIYLIILILVGFIILSVALFYFMPVPQAVKDAANNKEFERCIYSGGIGYYTKSNPGSTIVFYNSEGDSLCATGGHGTFINKPEGPCAQKMCFPVYDK